MTNIYFEEAGNGLPLVFLHGFCDSHEIWADFVGDFTPSYRVLMPDLPGFGRSPMLGMPFSIDLVGDEIAQWLEDLGIKHAIVIGHSLGGYIALSLLARHADRVAGIGLFHSTPFADTAERKEVREKVIQFVQLNGVDPFIETFVPGLFADKQSPFVESARRRALATKKDALIGYVMAMRDRPDRSKELLQSHQPCLILAGTLDPLIPADQLRKFAEKSEKCIFSELPGTAHMGIFEAKQQCQAFISSFIARVLLNK